jgi:predicted transcriptional regulator
MKDINYKSEELKELITKCNINLTRKELELIDYIFECGVERGISTTKLVEDYNYNRVTAWTYLERLVKKNVLTLTKLSKPSIYKISKYLIMMYEELEMNEIVNY